MVAQISGYYYNSDTFSNNIISPLKENLIIEQVR